MLTQEKLQHRMLSDKTQGSDKWQGMMSPRNPSNPLTCLQSLSCLPRPFGRGRLGPISSRWAGPGEGRVGMACLPVPVCAEDTRTMGYYSNKQRVIADIEMQISISCPLAFSNTLFIIICIKLVALTGHWISMGMRPKEGLENSAPLWPTWECLVRPVLLTQFSLWTVGLM